MQSFEDLLYPLSMADFLAEYWEKKPVLLGAGDGATSRFEEFPGLAQLPQLLAGDFSSNQWNAVNILAQASILDAAGNVRDLGFVPRVMYESLYNAGVSLCFGPLNAFNSHLTTLVKLAEEATLLSGSIVTTCYVTPPYSGSPIHFDSQNSFFCQVSGSKHWKYSVAPAALFPPINLAPGRPFYKPAVDDLRRAGIQVQDPDDVEFTEVTLRAGDVLYIPPGTWHVPHTTDSPSLHFTLTFSPLNSLHVMFGMMRIMTLAQPEWRADLRFMEFGANDAKLSDYLQDRLTEVRSALASMTGAQLLSVYRAGIESIGSGRLADLFRIV